MSSPSTLTTLISSAASTSTQDELSLEHDSSDKAAIIGLTVGVVVLFLLFIMPCCCFQWLAHRQQKKLERREAEARALRMTTLRATNVQERPLEHV